MLPKRKYSFGEPYLECNEGWYPIIFELFNKIQDIIDTYPENESYKNFQFSQIKEKYGTLRLYYYGGDDKIESLIYEYEDKSDSICENCGKLGKMTEKYHWYKTLCDDCYDKWK